MRIRTRIAFAVLGTVAALLPVTALGATVLANYAGTYYVTQIGDGAVARIDVNSVGAVRVRSDYVSQLQAAGPDSAVFAPDGSLIVSAFGSSISRVDVATRKVVTPVINKTPLNTTADLAVDPRGDDVVVIGWSQSGPLAIARVNLDTGATTSLNPSGIENLGGVTFNDDGSRLFASSHNGEIYELNPQTGSVIRKVAVQGEPDGMTYDPSSGYLYTAGCNGICELATGGDGGSSLSLHRVLTATDGDGIAADGHGHIFVAQASCGSLCVVNIAGDTALTIAETIPGADDVTPLVGAGSAAGTACLTPGTCFDGALAAGIGAASVGLVVYLGASALGGGTPAGGTSLRPAPAGAVGAGHGAVAAGHVSAVAPPHPPPHPPHPIAATAASHGPPGSGTASGAESHVQEEAGEKLLEMGGAGAEQDVAVSATAAAAENESAAGIEGGATRVGRDDDGDDRPPEPPPV